MLGHIKKAFFYSMSGLNAAIKEETAVRLVLIQAIAIIAFIAFYPLPYIAKALLLLSACICIIVELLNSAIENVVDLVTSDWHILAKKAKDMGSAAQFVALTSLYLQLIMIFLE